MLTLEEKRKERKRESATRKKKKIKKTTTKEKKLTPDQRREKLQSPRIIKVLEARVATHRGMSKDNPLRWSNNKIMKIENIIARAKAQ